MTGFLLFSIWKKKRKRKSRPLFFTESRNSTAWLADSRLLSCYDNPVVCHFILQPLTEQMFLGSRLAPHCHHWRPRTHKYPGWTTSRTRKSGSQTKYLGDFSMTLNSTSQHLSGPKTKPCRIVVVEKHPWCKVQTERELVLAGMVLDCTPPWWWATAN